jgi:two-component system, OmpR family, response regulator
VNSITIAIVEGNPHLRSLLGWHLQQVGYTVKQSANIAQARSIFEQRPPKLVILDTDLPDGNGLTFCTQLQQQYQPSILILSARTGEKEVVAGLKAGADDYLTKPFGMQEFLARVEALLRRSRASIAPLYLDYNDLKIDLVQRRVQVRENFIDLTPQEFSLLYVLAQAEGMTLSRSDLLRRAWPDAIDNPRTIDTHILSLRKKIEVNPRQPHLIQTVRNIGYRLNPEISNNSNIRETWTRKESIAEARYTTDRNLLGDRYNGSQKTASSETNRQVIHSGNGHHPSFTK